MTDFRKHLERLLELVRVWAPKADTIPCVIAAQAALGEADNAINENDANRLYNAANELMMQMLLDGQWDKRERTCDDLEKALLRIDGGVYEPREAKP